MLGALERTVWGLSILVLLAMGTYVAWAGLPSTTPAIAMESKEISEDELRGKLNSDQQKQLDAAIQGIDKTDGGEFVPRSGARSRVARKTIYTVDRDLHERLSNFNDCVRELEFAKSVLQDDGTLKVFDIEEGSLLEKIGLKNNDVLSRVDGLEIEFSSIPRVKDTWKDSLARLESGNPIVVEITRNGARHHLIVHPAF